MINGLALGGLTVVVVVVAAFGMGFEEGRSKVYAEWEDERERQEAARLVVNTRQAQETVKIVTEYIDRVQVIKETAEPIIKEVTVYVPRDTECDIPHGFVSVHNAAAHSLPVPEPAKHSNDAPSGIDLTTATETIAENYIRCADNTDKLIALQHWVNRMQAVSGSQTQERGN